MRFQYQTLAKAIRRRTASRIPPSPLLLSRSFTHFSSQSSEKCARQAPRRPFGIAFDIDGVLLRSESPIGGSSQALKRLYEDGDGSGVLRIPYVFLTNGGGFRESGRALELSKLLGVNVSPLQVLQGHTPFKNLVQRFENELVVAVGKGEPAAVMSEYGFKNVVSIDEYASYFPGIDPLAPYKDWEVKQFPKRGSISNDTTPANSISSQPVQAVFVVSDSIDWSRDIQVLCDILRTGGLPGSEIGHQPRLYFSHDDLAYQAAFPSARFGLGAFRIALESVFNSIHHNPLSYTCYGKPNPFVFKNAEAVLKQLASSSLHSGLVPDDASSGMPHFERLYMVGDNPEVDIKGAQQAGYPWFSILTRTGVFKGTGNHDKHPADLVVDTVKEAVDYIIRTECCS